MSVALPEFSPGDWDSLKHSIDVIQRNLRPPMPNARVYNNANISIPSGAGTYLTFNSERYNNGNMHSVATNIGRLTAKITGLYSIGACAQFDVSATGYRYVGLVLNHTNFIVLDERGGTSAIETTIPVATEYRLVAGDYVEVIVAQTSGVALNVISTANYSPEFWMHRVGGYTNEGIA